MSSTGSEVQGLGLGVLVKNSSTQAYAEELRWQAIPGHRIPLNAPGAQAMRYSRSPGMAKSTSPYPAGSMRPAAISRVR